jgi:ADP-heptose:LPS heptosyltransferase
VGDARQWKVRRYDLAINFEPDIRSNILLALSGARRLAGFVSGGGGPLLDVALPFDTRSHTADNAVRLVNAALGVQAAAPSVPTLRIPDAARTAAERLLDWPADGPLVAIHVSAGREVKQWPEARFRDLARALIERHGAMIVFTGAAEDRVQTDLAARDLPAGRVRDLSGRADLPTLAAVLERADLLVTVDTGPMHLAQAIGTPVVAVLGPSDPVRYAPRGRFDRVVRIDLPCAPCNRIRRPPARCVGHTPDCLAGIDVARVLAAVDDVLRGAASSARESAR